MQKPKKIVVLGAGFAGISCLRQLRKKLGKNSGYELILINDKNYFKFTPLLHEVATGGIQIDNAIEPLRKISRKHFDRFILAKATKVDTDKQVVHTDHCHINYDYLVIALGAKPVYFGVPGAKEYSFPLSTIDDAFKIKKHLICSFERASQITDLKEAQKHLNFVIVGGGPTGVELAGEIEELCSHTFKNYYDPALIKLVNIYVVQKAEHLLPRFSPKFQEVSEAKLSKKSAISIIKGTAVKEVGKEFVELDSGQKIDTFSTFWTGGIQPASLEWTGKEVPEFNKRGQIVVSPTLQTKLPNIFAAGDIACCPDLNNPNQFLPATAQVANKQGPAVATNIIANIKKQTQNEFRYQHDGTLVSLGRWDALAEVKSLELSGRFAWWVWRTIYLFKLTSFSKKLKVALDWTIGILSPRDLNEY